MTPVPAGTGVNVTASTKVMLGPLEKGVSGAVTFDLKGKNTEAVSINASVASTDLSMLAKNINEYASQSGLRAVLTSDFKQIIIESQDGYNINFKNITAPSDFYLETLGEDFTNQNSQKNPKLLIDVSNANKSSANIKGEIKFVSSENFSIQTDTGIITSAIKDPLKNGYININRSKSGESATITPEVFNDLDNSVGSPDGKKAVVGLSKYGLDINQKDYTFYVNDADSLYQDANPGVAGTLSLNGKLKDANNLNAVVSVYCSASETGNTFTVTGTNLSGTIITENITGGSTGTTVYGTTIFQTISSVTTSATASGNIKGEIKFVSSENFSIQTDTGIISSAVKDSLKNGYININRSKSGETATITPEVFNDLDNSVGSPDGKKAVVGLSKYCLLYTSPSSRDGLLSRMPSSA